MIINYLLVELDKIGNAKLSNNKINLKTISPTKLVTSKYTFDIANEILTYGSDIIDLKKIIGSTNTYTKEDLVKQEFDKAFKKYDVILFTVETIPPIIIVNAIRDTIYK